jgi:hypothetical protein
MENQNKYEEFKNFLSKLQVKHDKKLENKISKIPKNIEFPIENIQIFRKIIKTSGKTLTKTFKNK